jgi:hypothetical protein
LSRSREAMTWLIEHRPDAFPGKDPDQPVRPALMTIEGLDITPVDASADARL